MKTKLLLSFSLLLLIFSGCSLLESDVPTEGTDVVEEVSMTPEKFTSEYLNLESPLQYEAISSPITIKGEAKGSMYFEAQFGLKLEDGNGKVIAEAPVMASDEWMTEGFAPFTTKLEFTKPETAEGTIIFRNDNPSGLPENQIEIKVPVLFK